MSRAEPFNPRCTRCPRLAAHLQQIRKSHPSYHARPVAPFGHPAAALLVVGLAPGMHGANRSGRPFTGDFAGILLYQTLYDYGFASQPEATIKDDGLTLRNCRITNAVKCLPPENRPLGGEVRNCNPYLVNELDAVPAGGVILALGGVAHRAVVTALQFRQVDFKFTHGGEHALPAGRVLLDSYHCSRYNTQTRRLTEAMFRNVFARASSLLT